MQLLGQAGLQRFFTQGRTSRSGTLNADDVDDDLEDGYGGPGTRRKRQPKTKFPAASNNEGKTLMGTGEFGENECYNDVLRKRKRSLVVRLMNRELGINRYSSAKFNRLISQVRIKISRLPFLFNLLFNLLILE